MSTPLRVLELRSVRGTGGGPEKTILLGATRSTGDRVHVAVCYIRDERDNVFGIDAAARRMGVDYVEVRERHSFDLRVWPALRNLVRERCIDLVHAHDYKTNVLALMLGRSEGVIPLTTEHGWNGHGLKERWLYYPADKYLSRFFPRVIAVSEDIRQELIRHGASPSRVTTILNGIDHHAYRRIPGRCEPTRAALGLRSDDVVIGAVGRLAPEKRFDLLIEAAAPLMADNPRVHVVVVGDGESKVGLALQAGRLGLGSRVHLLGHRTDVANLHHAFDLLVQASSYEGTPNAVLEAMAMETPVVATDTGGTAQILRDGRDGLLVPVDRVDIMTCAIRQCFADPGAAATRARSARLRVEDALSFDARVNRVEHVYGELAVERVRQTRAALRAA